MKRILSVFLIVALCMGLIVTAAYADDVNTNTTVQVNVTYNNTSSPSTPSAPSAPSAPSSPGGGSSSSSSSSSKGYTERQKRNALRLFFIDLEKDLELSLEGTDVSIVDFDDREVDRSMRRVGKITWKDGNGNTNTCYVDARPKGRIRLTGKGKFVDGTRIEVFFSWRYRKNIGIKDYPDDWYITPSKQGAEDALTQFTEWLLNPDNDETPNP